MQPGTSDSTSDTSLDVTGGVSLPPVDVLLDDHGTLDGGDASDDTPTPGAIRYRLPLVAVPDNVMLKAAVQKLVEQKAQLDLLARNPALAGLLPPEWQGSGLRALDLQSFVLSVLPFLQNAAKAETAPARLPLKHVLGDTGRWDRDDVDEPKSLAFFLASDDRASAGVKDPAEAYLVGALGLAWAHEGRTRPGFLRQMGYDSMAARVSMLPYPEPGQLALYAVVAHGVSQLWCVLDRRKVRPLLAPWISVPLLTAYGVTAPMTWPTSFPPVEEVAQMLAVARTGKGPVEVDLTKVAAKVKQDASAETWMPVSLLQVGTWAPRWSYFMATFIGLPSALLVLAALALPSAVEAPVVAASLAFAGGAIGALAAPWVHARRKHLS
ncbi:hypothetical protein [Stenotrophomonas sp. 364]|uniref:hypothetical protein n=1 Tax=Stenotrophomonas sp. 364 TaxID=2691571 RepID=UPI00131897DE|nr:hypothetical protein [Stenotrophomonas sp. 364]QHB73090.1 hypothetical protein GQ674_18120 [Stenotrophomonas sp. 364]